MDLHQTVLHRVAPEPTGSLRSFTIDSPRPPDPPQRLVPVHSLILPAPPPPRYRRRHSAPLFCHHLVARALGVPTLVEVPFRPLSPARGRAGAPPSPAAFFSCNLCLEVAREPVITLCGHLFCWPCLFSSIRRAGWCCAGPCAVCGSQVDIGVEGNVVPIYGRGEESVGRRGAAPISGAPARPRAKRLEPPAGRIEAQTEAMASMMASMRRIEAVLAEEGLREPSRIGRLRGREVDGMGELVQVWSRRRLV